MDEYVVYILYSDKTGKSYVGFSNNLIYRIQSHNIFGKGYTAKFRPWIVVHVEFYSTKEEATVREKHFKSGRGHYHKEEIIQTFLNHAR